MLKCCRNLIVLLTGVTLFCACGTDTVNNTKNQDSPESVLLKKTQSGTDTTFYSVKRGGQSTKYVLFNRLFTSKPNIFLTSNSILNDFALSVDSIDLKGFMITLAYSSNASMGTVSGIWKFDWLAVEKNDITDRFCTGSGNCDYSLNRGESKTISITSPDTVRSTPFVLFNMNNPVSDLFISITEKSSNGFLATMSVSNNSSLYQIQGILDYQWLLIPSTFKNDTIEIRSDSLHYSLSRGEMSKHHITFINSKFVSIPKIFVTGTTPMKDVVISTTDKSIGGFDLIISLSRNSSAPNIQGDFTFDWMAIAN